MILQMGRNVQGRFEELDVFVEGTKKLADATH
jgi:hypothetical protein